MNELNEAREPAFTEYRGKRIYHPTAEANYYRLDRIECASLEEAKEAIDAVQDFVAENDLPG